jgi:hypothetical protein
MEIVNAPLCLFGHSNATAFVSGFGGKHPERVFAWIAFKSASGKQFSEPAIYPIPGLVLSGEIDTSYFSDQLATVKKLRKENHARMHMIVEPGGGHWPEGPRGTKTLAIVMAFIRTAYHLRVPADADPSKEPPKLIDAAEEKGWLSAYDIEKTGVLRLRQICASLPKDTPKDGASASDIVLSLDGRFLFCGIRGRTPEFNEIARYRVKEGGDLEFLGLTPADKIPWGFALSPDGRFLMVAAYEGATLKAYQISERGELKEVGSLAWDKNIMSIVTR